MAYALSILEKSPIADGESAAGRWRARCIWRNRRNAGAIGVSGWRSTTTRRSSPARRRKC